MPIILTYTRNQLNNFHTLSTSGLFVLGVHCQIFSSSLQSCFPRLCVWPHWKIDIYRKILNVQEKVTCLLVKYERIMGTSSLVMITKQTLMITLKCITLPVRR